MVPHSSTFAWKTPWMEEPGRLQSMGSLELDITERLHFHFSLSCIGEGNGNPLQCSCLENPRDGRAWWASVYGVTQSRTRLKRLSSSSSSDFGAKKNKVWHCFHCFPIYFPWSDGTRCIDLSFLKVEKKVEKKLSQLFHSLLSLSSRGFLVPLLFLP